MVSSTRSCRDEKGLLVGVCSIRRRRRSCATCSPNTAAAVYRVNAVRCVDWRASCAEIRPKRSACYGKRSSTIGALLAGASSARCRSDRTSLISFRFRSNASSISCRPMRATTRDAVERNGVLTLSNVTIAYARSEQRRSREILGQCSTTFFPVFLRGSESALQCLQLHRGGRTQCGLIVSSYDETVATFRHGDGALCVSAIDAGNFIGLLCRGADRVDRLLNLRSMHILRRAAAKCGREVIWSHEEPINAGR